MKKYLLLEGVTDVAFVKYICFKKNIISNFNDFKKIESRYIFKNLVIVNLQGQSNLDTELSYLKDEEQKIEKIAIIQDADKNFEKSKEDIEKAIENSKIDKNKVEIFLTPNNRDLGDLETLLLSTLDKDNIPQLQCFKDYKICLNEHIDIDTKAMDKGELYSYTMFSKDGKNYYTPQNSFMYKKKRKYFDTELWDLEKDEFQPMIDFILEIFDK